MSKPIIRVAIQRHGSSNELYAILYNEDDEMIAAIGAVSQQEAEYVLRNPLAILGHDATYDSGDWARGQAWYAPLTLSDLAH